ncbi:MAG: type II toxin-antitoxin system RelE/ParE family toxin [Candidatus Omnitrophica bacterium]|nr:type II toxin-antitoxin system RelE/ParE family toxin [Candidatus Omnitrophota bacterium]
MEQEPKPGQVSLPAFKVIWHAEIKKDFSKIPQSVVNSIVRASDYRLSLAPEIIGNPLKGTANRLWKIRFAGYRIVYTIHVGMKEVWVLSVQKRDIVYRDQHIQALLKVAVVLHEKFGKSLR